MYEKIIEYRQSERGLGSRSRKWRFIASTLMGTNVVTIVVCQNVSTRQGMVQGVLAHEMIHMHDYCRNHLNFKDMEHLACTEIRAANLTHCSFFSATSQGDASMFRIRQTHQDCVKTKALYSVLAVRQISKKEAIEVIEKVFPKCYADLAPIGRRIRRGSEDMDRAYKEGMFFGYL